MQYPQCGNSSAIISQNLVCNPNAAPRDRAAALVAAMTIDEKLVNLVEYVPYIRYDNNGLGAPKIGLPPYDWWSEALHGVATSRGVTFAPAGQNYSYATSFANPIILGAAFDDDLIKSVATVVSTEARAFANVGRAGLDFWTPNINPYKDPRWGRGMETPGEDPVHIQGYVKNLIEGLQGGVEPPIKKVIATCKHFAAYDLENWEGVIRYGFDAIVSTRDLNEYYLPPFQQCARDSKVGSIMCSYNAVNGVPSCANTYLMETILRGHWNWTIDDNYITSDCNAVQNFYANHNYTKTAAEAAGVAYSSGTDTVCEAGYLTDVIGAYNQSLLSVATIDQALTRLYTGLVTVGYFDPPSASAYRSLTWSDVNTPDSQQLARSGAADGIVVLKNDGTLPIKFEEGASVAVIGFWANATTQMLGGYSGIPPYTHSPLWAAEQLGLKVNYATGPIAQNTTTGNWTDAAMEAASSSDVILYFGGIDLSVEAESLDRVSISWSPSQEALISSLAALGKPLIVVQLGDQLDDSSLLQNANVSAIVWAGYPGQDGGPAIFDILTGAVAPAGRLPVTQYPASYVDQVPMTNMSLRPGSNNPGRTYKWYDDAVLPFGHGLQYTNFSASFSASIPTYDVLTISHACPGDSYRDLCPFPSPISITVKNEGTVTSDFVALVFVKGEHGPKPYPIKDLAAYTRVKAVAPGESREVQLNIDLGKLARVDDRGYRILYPGSYELLLDVPTQSTTSFELTGQHSVLDYFPQPPADQVGVY
ncbi:glycoside hydrolase family 3 protein [Xylogone sp. PMI_703]|nr:glycoside hydrolase family 3 protein [Xylogone sp. PMI_703]